jgi:hypothetical protein
MTGDPLSDSELLEGLPDRPELMGVLYERHALPSSAASDGVVAAQSPAADTTVAPGRQPLSPSSPERIARR